MMTSTLAWGPIERAVSTDARRAGRVEGEGEALGEQNQEFLMPL